ncbi:MAG: hypothetical protein JW838_05125 [Spirochaetes bacterium]|nr:hypothetical protein [Spirochaetota bacterium]
MKKPEKKMQPGAYLPVMINQADEKRDGLMNVLNGLTRLAYEKGTRKGDSALREDLARLMKEVEAHYRAVRMFASGKAGDREAFRDILVFFHGRYFEKDEMKAALGDLKRELADQERRDSEHNARHAGEGYTRKANQYAKRLEKELAEWEKAMTLRAEPLLKRFLHDVNDVVLYNLIDGTLPFLMTNDDVFSLSGPRFVEFKNGISFYVKTHLGIMRARMSEREIVALVHRVLQQMGFRNKILRARNLNEDRLNALITEICAEGKLVEYASRFSASPGTATEAIRRLEKKGTEAHDVKRLSSLLEGLCFLENGGTAPTEIEGLAKKENERYPFHFPGTFDASLKFVAEYMRNNMIFVLDWLGRELKRTPDNAMYLGELLGSIPKGEDFMKLYGRALATASLKSSRGTSSFGTREIHYIPVRDARELIRLISEICNDMSHALIDASYRTGTAGTDRSKALLKQIELVKENCGDARSKISKGLSEIRKA